MANNVAELAVITLACVPGHVIEGTTEMLELLGYRNHTHVCNKLRSCKAVQIIRGSRGRGHKTVYRLNRNSPGQRRRTR